MFERLVFNNDPEYIGLWDTRTNVEEFYSR